MVVLLSNWKRVTIQIGRTNLICIWNSDKVAVIEESGENKFYIVDLVLDGIVDVMTHGENRRNPRTGDRNKAKGWAVAMAKGYEMGAYDRNSPVSDDTVVKDDKVYVGEVREMLQVEGYIDQ